jgi:hypothetical protein
MQNIIEFRDDIEPVNDYPRRIVSPTVPSRCCTDRMQRIGHAEIDANWRFYYKRCSVCGYSVRCFYAPSLVSVLEQAHQIRLTLAEMNLGTGKRKRRTRAEIEREIAAAERRSPRRTEPPAVPLRSRKPAA